MGYFGPACPSCPPVGGVDAPARTEGHYTVRPAQPGYVAPNLAGPKYARPQYVAPNLAGYGGAGGLGSDVKKDSLKLAKIAAKLERRQPITAEERDYVVKAQPFPVRKTAPKISASDKAIDFTAKAMNFIAFAVPVPFLPLTVGSQVLYAILYGGDLGKIGKANLRMTADQLAFANIAVGFVPGVPVNFPKVTRALEKVCRALGQDKAIDAATLADLSAGVAGIFSEAGDADVARTAQSIKDVITQIQKIPGLGAAFSPQNSAKVNAAASEATRAAQEAQFNVMLARAKQMLQTTVGKAGPAGVLRLPSAGFRPGLPMMRPGAPGGFGAQRAGASSASSSASVLPILLLAGAAIVAVSVVGKRRK